MMNYNMQGMNKTIPKLFVMLKAVEVEKGQGKEGELQEEWQASCHSREEAQVWTQAWNWVLLLQRDWLLEAELPQVFGG